MAQVRQKSWGLGPEGTIRVKLDHIMSKAFLQHSTHPLDLGKLFNNVDYK